MVAGTLYTYPNSFRGLKSQVAAKYSGFDLKVVEVTGDDKSHKKVPSFETNDGKVNLFESNAIAFYVSNEELRGGASDVSRSEVLQWLEYGTNEIQPAAASWVYPLLGLVEFNKASVERAKHDVDHILEHLNDHLKTRTYLVGERVSLADISVAADLLLLYQHVLELKQREKYTNTNRWFTTILNQKNFKNVVGDVKLCEKALDEQAGKGKHADKPKEKKEEKKAEKKEEKKAEKKEEKKPEKKVEKKPEPAAEEAEEEDVAAIEERQSKDPLAEFPKGTLNLDEFKRTYSNKELTESLPYFWQNFDRANYSVWLCEYKYPEELQQIFMSSNLIGGMYQRLEKLRKHSFASMCVWGENNNNQIAGVWFWKGQELVFPLSPDWTTDYESYSWRKMNVDDEAERNLINQVFSWEGEFNGKKFADGKIFK